MGAASAMVSGRPPRLLATTGMPLVMASIAMQPAFSISDGIKISFDAA